MKTIFVMLMFYNSNLTSTDEKQLFLWKMSCPNISIYNNL